MRNILLIDDTVREMIAVAKAEAFTNPVTAEEIAKLALPAQGKTEVTLEDKVGFERPKKSVAVAIPLGYIAAVSYEHQPAGLCMHLSISVATPGRLPSPEAFMLIAQEYGLLIDRAPGQVWFEEFEPGHQAVNIVVLVKDTKDAAKDLPNV